MYPELAKIGPVTIYSYGLMLGLAFLVGSLLLASELKRQGKDSGMAPAVTIIALVTGLAGAKLLFLLDNWPEFVRNPTGTAFSSSGLTWYGGFLLAVFSILFYIKQRGEPFLGFADAASPSLAIGYAIARIGCHLAGDGDYGVATDLPWKVSYEYGLLPTAYTLDPSTGKRIPTEWVHPTPVYEFILALAVFAFLFFRRKKHHPPGNSFGWFLVLHSLSRSLVEFVRINPRLYFGLSAAQLISIALAGWGAWLIFLKTEMETARPPKKKPVP